MPLFPALDPFATHRLPVTGGHVLHLEEYGNPRGTPLVMLHGGPGGGINKKHPQYADPARFRVIVFDQRGCGASVWPGKGTADDLSGRLLDNTTSHLVADLEVIRGFLGVERWHVYGASWGSSLALAYAQAHPDRVAHLVVGAIFACNRAALEWFCQPPEPHGGMSRFYPDAYQALVDLLPAGTRPLDLPKAALAAMTGTDPVHAHQVVHAWSYYECLAMSLVPDLDLLAQMLEDTAWLLPHSLLECHYMAQHWFLEENQMFTNAHRLRSIPTTILQAQYDMVTPPDAARKLHALLPHSTLQLLPLGGHLADDAMSEARLRAITALPALNADLA